MSTPQPTTSVSADPNEAVPRVQKMLAAIAAQRVDGWSELESRAESLPAMLIRHGVLPVQLFLQSKGDGDKKGKADKQLWALVAVGIEAALPGYATDLSGLTKLSLEQYLLLQEVAVESATLVARWVKIKASQKS